MACEKCGTTKGLFHATNNGLICDTCQIIRLTFPKVMSVPTDTLYTPTNKGR